MITKGVHLTTHKMTKKKYDTKSRKEKPDSTLNKLEKFLATRGNIKSNSPESKRDSK